MTPAALPSSFRDPSGFLFSSGGTLFRQVNLSYAAEYDALIKSGLYQDLCAAGFLVAHEEVSLEPPLPHLCYKILKPKLVPFISYPYEWCFSQLKDAALLTLEIQNRALRAGLSLKDASAYNVQFVDGLPLFIDTLSFEKYQEGSPWVAYRQFCQHFLAPLALMSYCDIRLSNLLRIWIDGAPLDLASKLLPWKTHFKLGLKMHLHVHARVQARYQDAGQKVKALTPKISKTSLLGILDSLKSSITALSWKPAGTEWGEYYEATNYSSAAFTEKGRLVEECLRAANPRTVWDLGANTGVFSQIAAKVAGTVVAFDVDPAAVEKNYLSAKQGGEKKVLPLVLDLTNPSPALGWANRERMDLTERGPADAVMALALIHHLAISNNVPLLRCAEFLSKCGEFLIIEFVPKEDSQVQRLLASRRDIFDHYNEHGFEEAFQSFFEIKRRALVSGSKRIIYLMQRRK